MQLNLFDLLDPAPVPAMSNELAAAEPLSPARAMGLPDGEEAGIPIVSPAPKTQEAASGEGESATLVSLEPAAAPANLAQVLAVLKMAPRSMRRHGDMKSALRTAAKVLGRPLNNVPTAPADLRLLLEAAHPALAGVSTARWTRVRSLLLGALVEVGIDVMPGRDARSLSPEWTRLADLLPDKRSRAGLSRLLSYLSREGVEPANVDAVALARFGEMLTTANLRSKPEAAFRSATRCWNEAVGTIPGWPRCVMTSPSDPRRYALPWLDFPASFRADAEAFLFDSGNQDELADDYHPPVKASTVAIRRKQIHQLASGLVSSGLPIQELAGLAVLVSPVNARSALRWLRGRKGGESTPYLGQQAQLLRTIASYWVKAPEHDAALKRMALGLSVKPKGMIAKNRARLRQFDLAVNRDALLHLPARTLAKARRSNAGGPEAALKVMLALAVELLIVAPMRIDNLVGLELDRHLLTARRGHQRIWHIAIPAHETKTDWPIDLVLPAGSAALLETYIDSWRGALVANQGEGRFLFPGRNGERRSTTAFARVVCEFIRRETGLIMNVHLFRHLVGKLHLEAHPEDVETVRRVLGHRSMTTTLRSYAEIRNDRAFRRYDNTIAGLRVGAEKLAPPPRSGRVGTGHSKKRKIQ